MDVFTYPCQLLIKLQIVSLAKVRGGNGVLCNTRWRYDMKTHEIYQEAHVMSSSCILRSLCASSWYAVPDSKVHGANMGPIWGRQDPDGPHVGPMNFAIWVI